MLTVSQRHSKARRQHRLERYEEVVRRRGNGETIRAIGLAMNIDHRTVRGFFASLTVCALVVVNAAGDVIDLDTAQPIDGARTEDVRRLLDARRAIAAGQIPERLLEGTNTTISVVDTDAVLTKAQAQKIAQMAHDDGRQVPARVVNASPVSSTASIFLAALVRSVSSNVTVSQKLHHFFDYFGCILANNFLAETWNNIPRYS